MKYHLSPKNKKEIILPPQLDDYTLKECIGFGSFGEVYKIYDEKKQKDYAIKIISKHRLSNKSLDLVLGEAKILSSINHRNIIKFLKLIETKEFVMILTELIINGSLFDLIQTKKTGNLYFTDEEISKIFKGLLSALNYIHEKNIVHRDIKPENILIDDFNDLSSIKLIDFGLSCHFEDYFVKVFSQKCGTLSYMAPELLSDRLYSKPVDIWSCGIIMYEIMNGNHPFSSKKSDSQKILELIKNHQWIFNDKFSSIAQDFFFKLVAIDPNLRYTASQALKHPWITRKFNELIPFTFAEKISINNTTSQICVNFMAIFFINAVIKKQKEINNKFKHKPNIKQINNNSIEAKESIKTNSIEKSKNNFKIILRNSKTSEFESSNSNRNKSTIEPKISNIDFITFENEENKEENKNSPNQFRIKEIPNPNYTSLNNSSNIISKFNDSGTSFKNNTRHSLSKNSNFINGSLSPIKKPKLSNNNLQNIINKEINNNPIKIIDLNEIESNNKIKIKDKETYSVKSPSSLTKNKSNFAEISPRNNNNKKLGNIKLDKETLRELNHYTDRNFIKSIKASFRKLEIIEKINYENFSNSQNIFERENKNKNNEKSSFNIPSQDGSPINYCDLSGNSKGKEEFPKRNSTKSEANSPNINKKNKKECIFPSIIEDNNNLKNKFCNWSYSKNK